MADISLNDKKLNSVGSQIETSEVSIRVQLEESKEIVNKFLDEQASSLGISKETFDVLNFDQKCNLISLEKTRVDSKENAAFNSDLAAKQKEAEEVKNRLKDEFMKVIAFSDSIYNALEDELNELREEIEKSQKEKTTLEKANEKLDEQINEINGDIADIDADIEAEIANIDAEISKINESIAKVDEEIAEVEAEIQKLEEEIKALEAENATLKREQRKLERKAKLTPPETERLAGIKEQISSNNKLIDDKKTEITAKQTEKKELEEEKTDYLSDITELEDQKTGNTGKIAELNAEKNELLANVTKLVDEKNANLGKIADIDLKLAKKDEVELLVERFKAAKERDEAKIKALKDELEEQGFTFEKAEPKIAGEDEPIVETSQPKGSGKTVYAGNAAPAQPAVEESKLPEVSNKDKVLNYIKQTPEERAKGNYLDVLNPLTELQENPGLTKEDKKNLKSEVEPFIKKDMELLKESFDMDEDDFKQLVRSVAGPDVIDDKTVKKMYNNFDMNNSSNIVKNYGLMDPKTSKFLSKVMGAYYDKKADLSEEDVSKFQKYIERPVKLGAINDVGKRIYGNIFEKWRLNVSDTVQDKKDIASIMKKGEATEKKSSALNSKDSFRRILGEQFVRTPEEMSTSKRSDRTKGTTPPTR